MCFQPSSTFQSLFVDRDAESHIAVSCYIALLGRYNRLLTVITNSLRDLLKALKGLVVMSQQLEEMANSIFVNQVPTLWAGKVRLSACCSGPDSAVQSNRALAI